jgi:hypothetical protein
VEINQALAKRHLYLLRKRLAGVPSVPYVVRRPWAQKQKKDKSEVLPMMVKVELESGKKQMASVALDVRIVQIICDI